MDDKGNKKDGKLLVPETEKLFGLSADEIADELKDNTPDEREFDYPDVEADLKVYDGCESLPDYMNDDERSRVKEFSHARDLEVTFINSVVLGDWFNEDEFLADDENLLTLTAVPTAKCDDNFNHIDTILAVNNKITEHKPLLFAIDLTYNKDFSDMKKKFQWKHCYGKTEDAPQDVSEFGKIVSEKDSEGREHSRYAPLKFKFRKGLKIPGFASAKYFEDKENDSWFSIHEKGRITVMPRLVVGYSPEIIETMAIGKPTDHFRKERGESAYQSRKNEYENAERSAKWCTLVECREQVKNIRFLLEKNLYTEEEKQMDPEELGEAKNQIKMLDDYFTKAYEFALKKAENDQAEKSAMEYAEKRDSVCRSILIHSSNTYINRNRD